MVWVIFVSGEHKKEMCLCQKTKHLCNRRICCDEIYELFSASLFVRKNVVPSTSPHTTETKKSKVSLYDSLCSNKLIHRLTCTCQGFNISDVNQTSSKKKR